jgi:hypothetical protein
MLAQRAGLLARERPKMCIDDFLPRSKVIPRAGRFAANKGA